LYLFVNQEPITDPWRWVTSFCNSTGYTLAKLSHPCSQYWKMQPDSNCEHQKEDILKQFRENNYFNLDISKNYNECLELVVHKYFVMVDDYHLIQFSNRWDTFLDFLQGQVDAEAVRMIEQTIHSMQHWKTVLCASYMLICSEYIFDELVTLIADSFSISKLLNHGYIPITEKNRDTKGVYINSALDIQTDDPHKVVYIY